MRILIIEDEIKIANLLKKNLESVGHVIEMAHDGEQGLAKATNEIFDIVVLDIMLPKMNGFEIAKSLRDKENDTPIIMLTARDTNDDKKKSFEAGADDYLVKPVEFNLLLSRIDSLTRPGQAKGTRLFSRKEDLLAIEKNIEQALPKKNTNELRPGIASRKTKRISTDDITKKNPPAINKDITTNDLSPTHAALAANIANSIGHIENAIEVDALNKSIMDYAPMSIITINKDGFITSANKYFKQVSKTQKFKNHNVFTTEFFIRESLVDDYKNLLANGTIVRRERCYEQNSKGEDKYLKIIAAPIYDINGNIDGALSMALDNTEEVVSKNNLIDLNNSLELKIKERTDELKAANEELNKALKIKSAFAADVSHEMRTSLTIIQGNLELMARTKAITEDGAESSAQIFQEITRISEMLSNLTSLTNADAAKKLNYSKINLHELIEAACNSLKVVASEKNISIEHKKYLVEIEMQADKTKLEELILNLIRNAIKYNKNNGWIKIQAKKHGKNICICIEDSGIGISKKHLPYIFERFYRIDSARTRKTGGSGLGLAICKWIAEIHGGNINVVSTLGVGSTFSVCLPTEPRINDI